MRRERHGGPARKLVSQSLVLDQWEEIIQVF